MVGEIFLEHVCVSGQVVLFFSPPIYRVDLVRTSLCLAVFLWPPRLKFLSPVTSKIEKKGYKDIVFFTKESIHPTFLFLFVLSLS